MSTDTTTTAPDLPEPRRDATVMELAQIVADSRAFPECRSPAAAAVRILAGKEMGVGPIASVIGIRVSAGRVSMDATLMAGAIKRSERYDYQIVVHTAEICTLEFFEGQDAQNTISGRKRVGESSFSWADAQKAGLAKKDTWQAYPRNMLFARALSNGARWYCPAIFGGSVYSHEELGYTVDEEGRAVANGDGAVDDAAAAAGNELCTREQRQQIATLNEQCGNSMPGLLAEFGIRILDELSGQEAVKIIRKLEKRAAKKQNAESTSRAVTATATQPAAAQQSPQQALQEAFDESNKPSTRQHQMEIRGLAEQLEPDEDARYDLLVSCLTKRGCKKIAELNALQALALIKGMQAKIRLVAEEAKAAEKSPPFVPDWARGTKPK